MLEEIKEIKKEDYFKLYDNHNKSGIYSKEMWLETNAKNILNDINKFDGQTISERIFRYRYNILETPKCRCCNSEVKFKNKTIGFQHYCSNSCGAKDSKKKAIDTMLKTYGVSHSSLISKNIENRKNKRVENLKDLIGDSELVSITEDEVYTIKCDKCNKLHKIERKVLDQRLYLGLDWRDCITYSFSTSNGENELRKFIEGIYDGEIICNNRKVIGSEIDIYLPELRIGFEFNGLYWHCEINKKSNYHYNKYKSAIDNNVNLIQIFEDDWKYKQSIVKSRIINLLKLTENKIYARNCLVKEVKFKEASSFLNDNHLQGISKSKVNIGLFYNGELVSLMTFGKPRGNISSKKIDNSNIYELYRFCSKLNTNVIGSASKLFNYFEKNYTNINYVYSFSANEWVGGLYESIGMKFVSESKESYWYIKNHKRISRHNFNKSNLVKMGYDKNKSASNILRDLKIYKIYGAGNRKYAWVRNYS